MSITVKRNTGWLGMGANLIIKINGEKTTKIWHEETKNITIPDDTVQLKVSQFGTKSNEIEVRSGDTVEITSTKGSYLLWFSFFIMPMFITAFANSFMVFIFIYILLAVIIFLMNSFNLTVLDNEHLT